MRSHAWRIATVTGVLAGVGYFALDGEVARETLWRLTILGACLGILVGIRIHRLSPRHPWLLLLAALSLIATANVVTYPVWVRPWGQGIADLLTLIAFPLIGVAALALSRLQVPGGDRESAIDGLIVMVAMATVLAGTVFHPARLDEASLVTILLNSVVAPLMMAAVTAATFRLLFVGSARIPSAWLVVLAASSGLFGNTMRAFLTSQGTYQRGIWSDLFVLMSYVCIALAVLHPSSPRLTRRGQERGSRFSHARMVVLGASLLAAPVTLLVQGSGSRMPVAASVVLSLLVLWRLSQLVVDRERSRRELYRRADRQQALAELGLHAVDAPDLSSLFDEAAQVVHDLLDLRTAGVVQGDASVGSAAVGLPLDDDGLALVAERDAPWVPEDLAFLQAVANVLAGAIERDATQELLLRQAVYDSLTGLPNRSLILDRLGQELAACRRRDGSLAVMFVDLDGFKEVNDDRGHRAGDQLLCAVADRLMATVRTDDTVGRLAGDEFVVIGQQAEGEDARLLGDRILEALSAPFEVDDGTIMVSASVGVVVSTGHGVDADRLLAQADAAMYEAKRRPGGAVETYDERLDEERRRRRRIELDLDAAVARGELELAYQPLVRLGDRDGPRVLGAEALLRWHRTAEVSVPPSVFIPVAEGSDLIVRVGDHVIEQACRQLADWGRDLPPDVPFTLYVNLASRQLADPDLPARVAAVLSRTGIDPGRLGFEVAETAVLDERAICVARELSRLGARLALDDFGTGFTSIAHLKRLPLDLIKLDGSLIAGAVTQSEDRAIVGAVVAIARELDIEVLAEQVETQEQLRMVERLGCRIVQGYVFARPGPPEGVDLPLRTGPAPALPANAVTGSAAS